MLQNERTTGTAFPQADAEGVMKYADVCKVQLQHTRGGPQQHLRYTLEIHAVQQFWSHMANLCVHQKIVCSVSVMQQSSVRKYGTV